MSIRDIMTIPEFMGCVQCGAFIDDDGFGEILDENRDVIGEIRPSTAANPNFVWPKKAKYVEWFNR